MNTKQKILTVVALITVGLTLWFAPWTLREKAKTHQIAFTFTKPVWWWDFPNTPGNQVEMQLMTSVILIEWGGIGIAYAGLFFLIKDRRPPVKD